MIKVLENFLSFGRFPSSIFHNNCKKKPKTKKPTLHGFQNKKDNIVSAKTFSEIYRGTMLSESNSQLPNIKSHSTCSLFKIRYQYLRKEQKIELLVNNSEVNFIISTDWNYNYGQCFYTIRYNVQTFVMLLFDLHCMTSQTKPRQC